MRRFVFPILLLIVTALFLGPLAIASGNYAVGIVPPFEGGAPQVFTATDASPTGKWALPSITQANTLYVATNGSDSNSCSLGSPCTTYLHASGLATTPSISNQWLVVFGPGSYAENLALVPFVNITGQSAANLSQVIFSGNISLGSGFGADAGVVFGNTTGISFVEFDGNVTADFSVVANPNGVVTFFQDTFYGPVSLHGYLAQNNSLLFTSCFLADSTLTDVGAVIQSQSTFFEVETITLSDMSTGPANWDSSGDGFEFGSIALNGTNSGQGIVASLQSNVSGTFAFTGPFIQYNATVGALPQLGSITYSAGASPSEIVVQNSVPASAIDPTGSTAGYVITSTGPTTAPAWSLPTWVSLAAGGTLAPSPAQTRIVFDTTGAAGLVNLPASGTAVDGEEHLVKGLGATVTGSMTVNAGSGNTVESYASPGTLTGAAVIATTVHAGWVANWKYQLSTHEWILQGIY